MTDPYRTAVNPYAAMAAEARAKYLMLRARYVFPFACA